MTASLEHFLANNFKCTKDEILEVVKYFKHIEATKDEVLAKDNEVCRHLYFIIKGCVKAYFIDSKGQETIRYVALENSFISSIYSFISQTPSKEYICSVEFSELLAISYTDFKLALSTSSLFKDFYIKMLEGTYWNNSQRFDF